MIQYPAYVGSFHKSGCVLHSRILRGLHNAGVLKLWRADQHQQPPDDWDVCFDGHSKFMLGDAFAAIAPEARIVISVRDPRDLLVSGTRYHQDSKEPWLHQPREKLGGQTYQEHLNALASEEEKMLFELRHSSGNTVHNMLRVPYDDPRVMRVKLEELMEDRELVLFERLYRHLGFSGTVLTAALAQAEKCSLFTTPSAHARGGFAGEWENRMTDRVRRAFDSRFPDAARRLGY